MKKVIVRHKLLVPLLIVAVALSGLAIYINSRRASNTTTPTTTEDQRKEQEQKEFDPKTDSEQAIRNNASTKPSPSPTPAPVASGKPTPVPTPVTQASAKPIITGAPSQDTTSLEVDALVDGQTSGTCTATLSRAGYASVSASGNIILLTSYYACETMRFNKSGLAKGAWNLTVTFQNANARGTSDNYPVTVK